jgi:hypothetical protein
MEIRLQKFSHIYSLIGARAEYIRKIVAFEESARDPRRLFGRSTRLLEEEKFRRTCVPTLLSMEEELKRACVAMEEEEMSSGSHGATDSGFMYGGKRYLDILVSVFF